MIVTVMVAMLAIGSSGAARPDAPIDSGATELSLGRVDAVAEIAAVAVATQVGGGSGLPERVPPPRTMRDHWPVFALFSVVWLGIVGYVLTFNGRLKRMATRLGGVPGGGAGERRP